MKALRTLMVSLAAFAALTHQPAVLSGQLGTQGGEWAVYGGDPGHTRYAPLDQIDADNVGRLEIAWRWNARNFGPNPFVRSSTTPLMVGGVLYATAGMRRAVVAIDAGTGETLWTWGMDEGERLARAPRPNPGRGVSYWTDGAGDDRILVVTPGYHLVALDAATGIPVESFGAAGTVDLFDDHRTREGIPLVGTIGASSPATVVGDVVVVGSAHHVGLRPPSRINTPGDVRGFDARTGRLLWTFKTIPEAGEEGHETWLEGSSTYTGNAAVWAPISFDATTGYIYLPTEAATGDYYGGHRPGNNLFSTSLVCLDSRTGEKIWHFQMIHHDIWDWDNPTFPILADLEIDGASRKIVAQITKQGFTYVFDRLTGEPIWPIEERSVPQSDVPGEWTSPTQPFPTKPPPFDRQGFSEADLIDFTPELRAQALEVVRGYRMGPVFTPPSVADSAAGTRGTLSIPGSLGGANWEGGALDPETGFLFVGSQTEVGVLVMVPGGDRSDMNYILGSDRVQIAPGIPVVRPPWGRITALDLSSGDLAWTVPNGDTPEGVAERLGLDPADIPRTGKVSRAGLLVTRSLLFAGEGAAGAPILRALDKRTGETIASIPLPNAQVGLPMTYMHQGRQFIVISVGGGGTEAELVALALPPNDR
ncbi:MAG: PQQ-binding-like beta-propeller repeat protein [Gemmatimonadetes bacterium]|nr:PQQ-binding-like beta-propeller repeat protein [Gemmatimonadota bacterium]MDA1104457.1 PQQ-binding-like beta-propeller repeat protein [Gemmatimonadota bacterium]